MVKNTSAQIVQYLTNIKNYHIIEENTENGSTLLDTGDNTGFFALIQLDDSLIFFTEMPDLQGLDSQNKDALTIVNTVNSQSGTTRFYCSDSGKLEAVAMYPDVFKQDLFENWFRIWEHDYQLVLEGINSALDAKKIEAEKTIYE